VKPPVCNPGPKIEIPHLENHVLKVFRFRSWKPPGTLPCSARPCWPPSQPVSPSPLTPDGHCSQSLLVTRTTCCPSGVRGRNFLPLHYIISRFHFCRAGPRTRAPSQTDGFQVHSGSGSGPVTTQRVMGRTDGLQVHRRYKKKAEDQSEANVQTNTTAWRFRNELQ